MMLEFLRTNPDLLLGVSLVALGLMATAMVCVIAMIRIMLPSLSLVKTRSPELYREILGGHSESWVERRVGSLRDASISWRLMVYLYRGDQICEVVGEETCKRFARCVRWLLFAFPAAIALGGSAVAFGFVLAATQ